MTLSCPRPHGPPKDMGDSDKPDASGCEDVIEHLRRALEASRATRDEIAAVIARLVSSSQDAAALRDQIRAHLKQLGDQPEGVRTPREGHGRPSS